MPSLLHTLRTRAGAWIEGPRQQAVIIAIIIVNGFTLGLETIPDVHHAMGGLLVNLDHAIILIFVLEILIKLFAYGWRFFTNAWNVFDFLIVSISLVPATAALSVLRTLRVFRTLRLFNKVPRLRHIVESMLASIPSIGWVSLMLVLVFYIFAVIGTNLFGRTFPAWFGGLGPTFYTLFQVMTLESWSMGIARPVIAEHPFAFLYFVPFILLSTYTMLNLFIAIIVSTMQSLAATSAENPAETIIQPPDREQELLAELRRLNQKIDGLEENLKRIECREVTPEM
jgi:voltage-gated sodium channel